MFEYFESSKKLEGDSMDDIAQFRVMNPHH